MSVPDETLKCEGRQRSLDTKGLPAAEHLATFVKHAPGCLRSNGVDIFRIGYACDLVRVKKRAGFYERLKTVFRERRFPRAVRAA